MEVNVVARTLAKKTTTVHVEHIWIEECLVDILRLLLKEKYCNDFGTFDRMNEIIFPKKNSLLSHLLETKV